MRFLSILLGVVMSVSAYSKDVLKVLVTEDGLPIYSESSDASVLSTFSLAVKGSFFSIDNSYELKSSVVKTWNWDSKNNTYILKLDPDYRFHDGSKPNSKDLEFSLLRGFFSDKQSFYEIYLGGIEGIDKVDIKEGYRSGAVSGVSIIDDLTISVKLKNLNPSFLFSLTRPYFGLVSEKFYKSDLLTWKNSPIGAGKYKFDSEDSDKIILASFSSSAKYKKIELYKRYIPSVAYDISYTDKGILPSEKFLTQDPMGITTIFFNQVSALSKNQDFRDALFYLLDRKKIISFYDNAKESYEFLPSNFWSNNEIKDEHSIEKAKNISEKIPKVLKDKVWKVPVFYPASEFDVRTKKVTDEIERQISTIGIKVKFYPDSNKFLPENIAKESAFSFKARICDNLDPLLMFGSFKTNSAYKYDNVQNDIFFDKLYREAAESASTADRVETMRKLSKYALDKRFFIPLVEKKNVYYYNPKTVKSLGNQISPTTLDFDQIEMK